MSYFKAPDNSLHFLDDDQFSHLLPPGSVQITDDEARAVQATHLPSEAEMSHFCALAEVQALETRQARAIREAVLTGDKTWLLAIEQQVARSMGRASVVQ